MDLVSIKDEDFDAVVKNAEGTVVVDVWGDGCAPCKIMENVIKQISIEQPDVTFVKMNMNDGPKSLSKLGLSSLPTLYMFKDGKLKKEKSGLQNKAQLAAWLAS